MLQPHFTLHPCFNENVGPEGSHTIFPLGEGANTNRTAMKRTLILHLVGLLFWWIATRSQAQTTGGTEKAVAALEQQWLQSQKINNPDLLAPLLADKFVSKGSDGQVESKAESLARAKATKYDSAEYDDVKVTVFGDTAIATGGFSGKGTDAS